jgi:hypothetical protein
LARIAKAEDVLLSLLYTQSPHPGAGFVLAAAPGTRWCRQHDAGYGIA